jgi:hypothetical protein
MGTIEDEYYPHSIAGSRNRLRKSLIFKLPQIFALTFDENNVKENNLFDSALEQNVNTPHVAVDAGLSGLRELNRLAVIGRPSIASRRVL